jgi:hypothetical protein
VTFSEVGALSLYHLCVSFLTPGVELEAYGPLVSLSGGNARANFVSIVVNHQYKIHHLNHC